MIEQKQHMIEQRQHKIKIVDSDSRLSTTENVQNSWLKESRKVKTAVKDSLGQLPRIN